MRNSGSKLWVKQLIAGLLGAAQDAALVPHYDGGKRVDIIWSQKKGQRDKPMTLREAENRLDKAIRHAWKQITGENLPAGEDPVSFVMES